MQFKLVCDMSAVSCTPGCWSRFFL